MSKKLSSEQKLLQVIQGGRQQVTAEIRPALQGTPVRIAHSPLSAIFLISQIVSGVDFLSGVKKVVLVYLTVAVVGLIAAFIYPETVLKHIDVTAFARQAELPFRLVPTTQPKSLEERLAVLDTRNIFKATVTSGLSEKPPSVVGLSSVKDITLIAVLSGENPQAVIEDKNSKKIYYVVKGQTIGEFIVDDIQPGKVIIGYKGTNYEIYL